VIQVNDFEPNIIFIVSDSYSHNKYDMREGVRKVIIQLLTENEIFFKQNKLNIEKFEYKLQYLSGVVFRGNWIPISKSERTEYKRNVVMRNRYNLSPISEVDDRIFTALENLDLKDEFY